MTKTNTNITETTIREEITTEELVKAVEEYLSYKSLIEQAQAETEKLEELFRSVLEGKESNQMFVGDHKISMAFYTRESVSAKDVKPVLSEEEYAKIVKLTACTRFTVK